MIRRVLNRCQRNGFNGWQPSRINDDDFGFIMISLSKYPIRWKLFLLAIASVMLALLTSCGLLLYFEVSASKQAKIHEIQVQGRMLAFNATGLLTFQDDDAATQLLDTLKIEPSIEYGCFQLANGKTLATYRSTADQSPTPLLMDWPGYRFNAGGDLEICHVVRDEGRLVGRLHLIANMDDIDDKVLKSVTIAGVVLIVALLLASALALRLSRGILRPLRELSDAARHTTEHGDYSVRVAQFNTGDEVGQLCSAFNEMLDRIDASEKELRHAHADLEQRVLERTEQLELESQSRIGQAQVLEQLGTGQPLRDVLTTLVIFIQRQAPGLTASIQLFDKEASCLRNICSPSLPKSYLDKTEGIQLGPQEGSCGTAAFYRSLTVVEDTQTDSRWEKYRDAAAEHGLIACWSQPIISCSGDLLGTVAWYWDHPCRPQSRELELLEVSAHLAGIAIEQKQAEEQLCIAKEQAEASSHAKSEFLANMSHEIRTPLNGILGFTNLLMSLGEEVEVAQRQDFLGTIHSSGQQLLTLINDILDLSKIEAGQVDLELQNCSPANILSETVSLLRAKSLEKGISLVSDWSTQVPETVQTDPARLRQLLMNLVGNAVKFTSVGRVVIDARISPDRTTLIFEVSDTGIGIPTDKIDVIFDPFVQADSSVTREYGGTGLGLSICRRIVSALGGKLTVQSELGMGSAFLLQIPTGDPHSIVLHHSPPADGFRNHVDDSEPTNLDGIKILLAEDGEINSKYMSTILGRAGALTEIVDNGQLAVTKAESESFDIILMDMQMPVLDGYTATRRLRGQGCKIPIIALTAHAMKGDAEKCLEAGCSHYLSKPVDANHLLQLISTVVSQPDAGTGEFEKPEPAELRQDGDGIVSTLPMDDPVFCEIVAMFVEFLRTSLDEIHAAIADGDRESLAKCAHTLKGAGGSAGFDAFNQPCSKLQQVAADGDEQIIEALVAEIVDLSKRVQSPANQVADRSTAVVE